MRRWTRRSVLPAVILTAAGCAQYGIFQEPLATDQPVRPQSPDASLVLGGAGQADDWTARRNDGADGPERQLYYGPSGKLYYDDGSPLQFDSVKQQLRDLRAEENIRPR
ncbi:MAG: hypothetical protein ACYS1B_12230 [Planctomycetota bacterium]|jgi:hypothetical protein